MNLFREIESPEQFLRLFGEERPAVIGFILSYKSKYFVEQVIIHLDAGVASEVISYLSRKKQVSDYDCVVEAGVQEVLLQQDRYRSPMKVSILS